jgi:flagellar basal body-associated protein FliL
MQRRTASVRTGNGPIFHTKEAQKRKKESAGTMKKSYLVAVIAVLAAVAGALAAVAVYLYRREKELDEYEDLLFGEDEDEAEDEDDASADGKEAEEAEAEEPTEAPAEDAAEQ